MTTEREILLDKIKQILHDVADQELTRIGFVRHKDSSLYKRKIEQCQQSLEFKYRSLSKDHVIYLGGFISITIQEINAVAAKISYKNQVPIADDEPTIKSQIGLLGPEKNIKEWQIRTNDNITDKCYELIEFILVYVIPFLDTYINARSIIYGFEQQDPHLPFSHNELLIIAAAYICNQHACQARYIVEDAFGSKAGLRREYEYTLEYLTQLCPDESGYDTHLTKIRKSFPATISQTVDTTKFIDNYIYNKSDYSFILKRQDNTEIKNPAEIDIKNELSNIHPKSNSFFILSRSDGSYLQVAGAKSKLTVEYHTKKSDATRHFVLGLPDIDEDRDAFINSVSGPIQVKKYEVLTIANAIEIFTLFLQQGRVPTEYLLRDISSTIRTYMI